MSRSKPGQEDYSAASSLGYADREVAKTEANADIAIAGITMSGNLVREFISVAKSNPIVGVLLAIAATDLLANMKVLSPQGKAFMYTAVGVAFGVSVGVEIAEVAANVISAVTGGSSPAPNPAELIQPVATTIVENPPPPPPATRGSGGGGGRLGGILSNIPAGALLGE